MDFWVEVYNEKNKIDFSMYYYMYYCLPHKRRVYRSSWKQSLPLTTLLMCTRKVLKVGLWRWAHSLKHPEYRCQDKQRNTRKPCSNMDFLRTRFTLDLTQWSR